MSEKIIKEIMVNIKLIGGVEGKSLYINDRRVAGPKPWGGGSLISEWSVPLHRLKEALSLE